MSPSVMPADSLMDHVDAHFGVLDLSELRDCRLDRPDDVALQDEVQVLDRPGLHLLVEPLDRDATRALRELFAPQALAARVRKLTGAPLVLDHASQLAGRRRLVEAEDLDRVSRPGVLHLVAAEVVEGAHLAPSVSGDDRVADAERAAVDEHRCYRTAADVESRFDDRA